MENHDSYEKNYEKASVKRRSKKIIQTDIFNFVDEKFILEPDSHGEDYEENIYRIAANKKLPWVEKYRPGNLNNIISHKEMLDSLKKCIDKRTLPHLLFFGPSGCGKTSTINCCAKELYGKYINFMVLHLNASNDRGIDIVRGPIKNFVSNMSNVMLPKESRDIFKLIILDEIDSMTVEAQSMLRQIIEKNSHTTRFCLICNEIDKVNIALQSRCTLFRFVPLNKHEMKQRLIEICNIEKIQYEPESIDAIVKIADGDMRSAINTLQSVNLIIDKKISDNDVYRITSSCNPIIIKDLFLILENVGLGKNNLIDTIEKCKDILSANNIIMQNLFDELNIIILDSKKFNLDQKIFLIDNLAKSEVYDSVNIDVNQLIYNICSMFLLVKQI